MNPWSALRVALWVFVIGALACAAVAVGLSMDSDSECSIVPPTTTEVTA